MTTSKLPPVITAEKQYVGNDIPNLLFKETKIHNCIATEHNVRSNGDVELWTNKKGVWVENELLSLDDSPWAVVGVVTDGNGGVRVRRNP